MFQRVLLFLNPEFGISVHCVYRISRLYDRLSERSALVMIAAWRGSTLAVTRAKYRPSLYDDERQSRALGAGTNAARGAAGERANGAHGDRRFRPLACGQIELSPSTRMKTISFTAGSSGVERLTMFPSRSVRNVMASRSGNGGQVPRAVRRSRSDGESFPRTGRAMHHCSAPSCSLIDITP